MVLGFMCFCLYAYDQDAAFRNRKRRRRRGKPVAQTCESTLQYGMLVHGFMWQSKNAKLCHQPDTVDSLSICIFQLCDIVTSLNNTAADTANDDVCMFRKGTAGVNVSHTCAAHCAREYVTRRSSCTNKYVANVC